MQGGLSVTGVGAGGGGPAGIFGGQAEGIRVTVSESWYPSHGIRVTIFRSWYPNHGI